MSQVNIDRSQSSTKNLEALQRMDPNIMEILGKTSHVAVYVFEHNEWLTHMKKRKDVEGSLFVIKRFDSPRFQLIVMNRLSTVNLVQQIDANFQMELLLPYLILKVSDLNTKTNTIYGIWFFTESDRGVIHKLLERIVKTQQRATISGGERDFTPVKPRTTSSTTDKVPPKVQQPISSNVNKLQTNREPPLQHTYDVNSKSGAGRAILGMLGQNTSTLPLHQIPPNQTSPSGFSGDFKNGPPLRSTSQHTLLTPSNVSPSTIVAPNSYVVPPRPRSNSNASSTGSMSLLTPANLTPMHGGPSISVHNNRSNVSIPTKEQFKQNLLQLLQDDEFMETIHRAYISRYPNGY